MTARRDHYAVLGVIPTASQAEIRAAYRRLARDTHPDRHPGDAAAERSFKRIAHAYEVIGDPRRRRAYDRRAIPSASSGPGPSGQASFDPGDGSLYHSDLGHHSDFYQAGDPLTLAEAGALVRRDRSWLRRAIREGRLPAELGPAGYLVRRRALERFDRSTARRRPAHERLDNEYNPMSEVDNRRDPVTSCQGCP
jgi:curved DNA-binding protein CbpA